MHTGAPAALTPSPRLQAPASGAVQPLALTPPAHAAGAATQSPLCDAAPAASQGSCATSELARFPFLVADTPNGQHTPQVGLIRRLWHKSKQCYRTCYALIGRIRESTSFRGLPHLRQTWNCRWQAWTTRWLATGRTGSWRSGSRPLLSGALLFGDVVVLHKER